MMVAELPYFATPIISCCNASYQTSIIGDAALAGGEFDVALGAILWPCHEYRPILTSSPTSDAFSNSMQVATWDTELESP